MQLKNKNEIKEAELKVLKSANIEMLKEINIIELTMMLKQKNKSDSILFYCNQALIFSDSRDILTSLLPRMTFDELTDAYHLFKDGDVNIGLEKSLGISESNLNM